MPWCASPERALTRPSSCRGRLQDLAAALTEAAAILTAHDTSGDRHLQRAEFAVFIPRYLRGAGEAAAGLHATPCTGALPAVWHVAARPLCWGAAASTPWCVLAGRPPVRCWHARTTGQQVVVVVPSALTAAPTCPPLRAWGCRCAGFPQPEAALSELLTLTRQELSRKVSRVLEERGEAMEAALAAGSAPPGSL